MNRVISSLCLVTLCALTTGCSQFFAAVGKPEVTAVKPRVTGIDMNGVNLAFDVDVHNPYFVPLKAPQFKYGIAVEGSSLASGEAPSGIDLPANGTGTASLPIRLSYADIQKVASKLSGAKEFAYSLTGAFVVSAMGESYELPISHSGTLPIVRPPKFSNVKLDVSNLSFGSADVTVQADMENPNAFEMGVNQLGYALKVGDTPVGDLAASTPGKVASGQSGHITLNGKISAASAILRLAQGASLGVPKIVPSGAIDTPYGPVKLTP